MVVAEALVYLLLLSVGKLKCRFLGSVLGLKLIERFFKKFPFTDVPLAQAAAPYMATEVYALAPREGVMLLEHLQVRSLFT